MRDRINFHQHSPSVQPRQPMIVLGQRTKAILAAVFVLLPILELVLLVLIGRQLGALVVVLYVVALGLVGSWVIRRRWRSAWRSVQQASAGELPSQGLADGLDTALVVAGGLALIFPGVITDLFGLICLLPFTRTLPRRLLVGAVDRAMPGFTDLAGRAAAGGAGRRPGSYGDVIEGEVVEEQRPGPATDDTDEIIIRGEIDDNPRR